MVTGVSVRFSSSLRRHAPAGQEVVMVELKDTIYVEELLDRFPGLKAAVGLILVNGQKAGLRNYIKPGDAVEVFPLVGGG